MSEYLEKKCENLGIRLVYTYNKTTVLSAEIHKEKPLLIADMLFKNCPDLVSQAIIGFFTDTKNKSSHEKIIKNFVEEYFKPYRPGGIKYLDLSHLFKPTQGNDTKCEIRCEAAKNTTKLEDDYEVNIKDTKPNSESEDEDYEHNLEDSSYKVKSKDDDYKIKFDMDNVDISKIDINDSNLVEFGVYSINAKDFWGGEKQIKSNTSIKPLKNEELQLNIVVLPPGT